MAYMATTTNSDQQYRLVYNGIVAVAARCDGAVDDDGVGFNGQDTKFGRRIASVPFEEWTEDIKEEAARIAVRYQRQIEAYTGTDVTALEVVRQAFEAQTNKAARDQARDIERREAVRNGRVAVVLNDSQIQVTWVNRDPDFSAMLSAVRALPGRRWNGSANLVDHSQAAVDFFEEFDFVVEGEIIVPDPAAEPEKANDRQIRLEGNRVRISFDYDAALVSAVRSLPGRKYDGSTKTNTADLTPEVVIFGDKHDFDVDPAIRQAVGEVLAEAQAEDVEADLRRKVSGLANPADLPEDFVQQVLDACPKAQVV